MSKKPPKWNHFGPLTPQPMREITFRGVRFYTRNLGAVDPMNGNWVWMAVGAWTHDQAAGAFSDLTAAIADRFNIWEHLGLSYAPKFRDQPQLEALAELEREIAHAMKGAA